MQNQFSEPPKSAEIVTPERQITKMLLKSARGIPEQIGEKKATTFFAKESISGRNKPNSNVLGGGYH